MRPPRASRITSALEALVAEVDGVDDSGNARLRTGNLLGQGALYLGLHLPIEIDDVVDGVDADDVRRLDGRILLDPIADILTDPLVIGTGRSGAGPDSRAARHS